MQMLKNTGILLNNHVANDLNLRPNSYEHNLNALNYAFIQLYVTTAIE